MASISKIEIDGQVYTIKGDGAEILCDTTAGWQAKTSLVSQVGYVYVYTDHQSKTDENNNIIYIPGVKIGDGNAYVVDLPFTDTLYAQHIADTVTHITQADRNRWDNKVTCFIDDQNPTTIVFTRDYIDI